MVFLQSFNLEISVERNLYLMQQTSNKEHCLGADPRLPLMKWTANSVNHVSQSFATILQSIYIVQKFCNMNQHNDSLASSKGKGSPYSITERRIPELIPVLGSQPAGDGRLPLHSARPAVTPTTLKRAATDFAAWWTEAQWVWDCYLTASWLRFEPGPFCAWVQHAKHLATEPPLANSGSAYNRQTILTQKEATCNYCYSDCNPP